MSRHIRDWLAVLRRFGCRRFPPRLRRPPTRGELLRFIRIMAESTDAQDIIGGLERIPDLIDAYTADQVARGRAALQATHDSDLGEIRTALGVVTSKLTPSGGPSTTNAGTGGDSILGGQAGDSLGGADGADTILSPAGNDVLEVQPGQTMVAGSGNDTF